MVALAGVGHWGTGVEAAISFSTLNLFTYFSCKFTSNKKINQKRKNIYVFAGTCLDELVHVSVQKIEDETQYLLATEGDISDQSKA